MAKKTINVEATKIEVNKMLAISTCEKDVREGMINVIEHVLMSTGNYRGFRYLSENEVPAFEKPGIRLSDEVFRDSDATAKFNDTDHTRVQYF